jgi:hypothetical protein
LFDSISDNLNLKTDHMKKLTLLMRPVITLVMVFLMSQTSLAQVQKLDADKHTMMTPNVHALAGIDSLKTNMRHLWVEHVTWTRNVILCIVDELPGKDQAVKRLLKNQVDLGNAIKPYYGKEAGEKLTKLLYPHITIAAEVVEAAKAGNTAVLAEANKRWYANADEISVFLSTANPHWKLADMKVMMNEHLKLTTEAAVSRIKKDYDADVIAYDKVHHDILLMADMLTDGIVRQFPGKFKKGMKTVSN